MARIEQQANNANRTILNYSTMESRPAVRLRDVEFVEFENRMLELKFSSEETKDAWDILSRR